MLIATWNVNSVRQRLNIIQAWIKANNPDVLLLQEIKCVEKDFPTVFFEDMGYNVIIFGQKTFNGVAILSKHPVEDILVNMPTMISEEARYLECIISHPKKVLRVASVYVPNGQQVGSEKYHYKLDFLNKLYLHMENLLAYEEIIVIGGDFNIAPRDLDVYDPVSWHESILCSTVERKAYQSLLNLGYYDALEYRYPDKQLFTWWDYRQGSFKKNHGLRIDHLLLSPYAVDRMLDANVDDKPRQLEKTSDHAPVWCRLIMD